MARNASAKRNRRIAFRLSATRRFLALCASRGFSFYCGPRHFAMGRQVEFYMLPDDLAELEAEF
jgi:hypothetical protein